MKRPFSKLSIIFGKLAKEISASMGISPSAQIAQIRHISSSKASWFVFMNVSSKIDDIRARGVSQ